MHQADTHPKRFLCSKNEEKINKNDSQTMISAVTPGNQLNRLPTWR
jgi:hypothetical protein